MRARHNAAAAASMPAMAHKTQYELKAAPTADEAPLADEAVVHEWAGDEYDVGDESDPAQAFTSFAGTEGEEAWLDRAEDGALTGWVRDSDGTVYRYIDAEAWGIDVDQAGMRQVHINDGPEAAAEDTPGENQEPAGDLEPAPVEETVDLPDVEEPQDEALPLPEDGDGEGAPFEQDPQAPEEEAPEVADGDLPGDELEAPAEDEPAGEPADEEDEEDEDLPPFLEGKSWHSPAGTFTFRPL